jgi:hypothetical protein
MLRKCPEHRSMLSSLWSLKLPCKTFVFHLDSENMSYHLNRHMRFWRIRICRATTSCAVLFLLLQIRCLCYRNHFHFAKSPRTTKAIAFQVVTLTVPDQVIEIRDEAANTVRKMIVILEVLEMMQLWVVSDEEKTANYLKRWLICTTPYVQKYL